MIRPDDDERLVAITINFSQPELATIDELVGELRELYDPDMDRQRLLGRI